MGRERFSSRLGFILISAGCAIGLGNVWRFPYIVGQYGGAAFVLIYAAFLVLLGLPIIVMEYSVGRASQKSAALSFDVLEPKGTKWHFEKWFAMAGNYVLMMFYTTVAGWLLLYVFKMAKGDFVGLDADGVAGEFGSVLANPGLMTVFMLLCVVFCFSICAMGLQNGVEKITKMMMVCLLFLMVVLAINSVRMEGGRPGLEFYLKPDFGKIQEVGVGKVVFAALGQSFFTLSIGIEAGQGPSLIFITLPNVFNHMAGGRFWGTLFFVFMTFAAASTVTAVFQNIVSFATDLTGCSIKKAVCVNLVVITVLSLPCVLGFNLWSGFMPFGEGSNVLDLEDFIVSNNLLPLGSLVYLMFCTSRYGWGFENFLKEANEGKGVKFPRQVRAYVTYVIPLIGLFIFVQGYWSKFFQ